LHTDARVFRLACAFVISGLVATPGAFWFMFATLAVAPPNHVTDHWLMPDWRVLPLQGHVALAVGLGLAVVAVWRAAAPGPIATRTALQWMLAALQLLSFSVSVLASTYLVLRYLSLIHISEPTRPY